MATAGDSGSHPELHELLVRLRGIYDAVSNFHPLTVRPPILDSSLEADAEDDTHWSHQDHIPGLKKLKESLKLDLDGLEKFLDDPTSAHRPPLSTNAPYLISVWNELLCAPGPVLSLFKMFLFEPRSDSTSSNAHRKKNGVRPPGAKVDIVADGGRVWIRINTMKNSRLLAEFREIDSYLTDSDSDPEWDNAIARPTLAQPHFDNTILKMGRTLLQAAEANPIEGTTEIPRIVMRLTRLDPSLTSGPEADPRIAETMQKLKDMGIEVQLGERSEKELARAPMSETDTGFERLVPSRRINLDLSVLIALISDLTHAPLPTSIDEANKRFIPSKEYREWKQSRKRQTKPAKPNGSSVEDEITTTTIAADEAEMSIEDLPHDLATHSRALTNQLLGEMSRSMIQEILDCIGPDNLPITEFWVTKEARDRGLRIVSKIGAVNEKRRAFALFFLDPSSPSLASTTSISQAEAEELFWQGSRFAPRTLPLFPLHFHESPARQQEGSEVRLAPELLSERKGRHSFFKELAATCRYILDQEATSHPGDRFAFISQPTPFPSTPPTPTSSSSTPSDPPSNVASPSESVPNAAPALDDGEIQRAVVTKANPRLTAHTVESMLWGAELGWTTLTANRTSLRAMMKEMRVVGVLGKLGGLSLSADGEGNGEEGKEEGMRGKEKEGERDQVAALWILDPRSLAEQMSSSSSSSSQTPTCGSEAKDGFVPS